ncbi:SAICAR synthase-like protein [Aspergillus heteromorphus CBS 117.55]|uniref:1-phosphatidylinositol-4-phosphate 5-kinase n=1 Tax=Aspergillus heteromorphus CBS 117.55 TaxID=1448321 RepID=A0A317UZN7_9EURO|nr:SAICAR synthase-like protein [Aspergillus heteromorphus CBS 117.55]PWY67523.1 SAICAR synthase-like protein [Aspergillus heteromorphus CBS 117.55]
MPSFSNDVAYQSSTATATHPRPFDSPQGKAPEKNSVGNTFLWTNWPNGDANHLDAPPNDHQLTNGSAYSLNGPRSSASSYTRDLPHSKDGSMHSLGNGSAREPREGGRPSNTLDRDTPKRSAETRPRAASPATSVASQQVNGTLSPRSLNGKPTVNGDHVRPSADEMVAPDSIGNASATRLSTSQPDDAGRLSPDPDRLSPSQKSPHRYSSPPVPPSMDSSAQEPTGTGLRHRHTLQVPKTTGARRSSRDHTDDAAYSSGRLSPTTGARRTSFSLARRATRTNQSDSFPDDAAADEDAARWAEAIKQRRASKRRRRDDDEEDHVIVGTKVDQNHVNYVTAYNMLTGIRFTVSRINAKMDRELTPADFEAKHKFSFDITGNELTPSAKYDFKFKDYAPWVFRHLRAKFRLDPADYLMSLTSKYILSELGSPGKSGSFFYFSRDYKYIIKTIHHSEHKLLRKILPEYYRHVEKNPNTLISQFYGLHRVKMAYGRKIHFVVMNNLFPPHRDIHQTFDLKGSMIGRDLREEDLEKNPRATLKDLNWVRREREIQCGPSKRDIFLAQLKRDVELLKKLKIMDYSLLVGIHDQERGNEEKLRDKTLQVFQPGGDREEDANPNMLMRTPSKLENERKARELRMLIKRERPVPLDQATAKMPDEILDERKHHVFYSDDGGFRATHENGQPGDEIYYLGIIDCLTHYGFIKKIEHFFKGLSHDRTQISPIPPEGYGDRFVNFVKGITMSKEEGERHREARAMGRPSAERSESVERTMQAAEKEASKDISTAEPRTLSTVRDPGDPSTVAPSFLPIVDEAGEASSVGGHSQHSRHRPSSAAALDKELPAVPQANGSPFAGKGKGVSRDGQPDWVSSGRQ